MLPLQSTIPIDPGLIDHLTGPFGLLIASLIVNVILYRENKDLRSEGQEMAKAALDALKAQGIKAGGES